MRQRRIVTHRAPGVHQESSLRHWPYRAYRLIKAMLTAMTTGWGIAFLALTAIFAFSPAGMITLLVAGLAALVGAGVALGLKLKKFYDEKRQTPHLLQKPMHNPLAAPFRLFYVAVRASNIMWSISTIVLTLFLAMPALVPFTLAVSGVVTAVGVSIAIAFKAYKIFQERKQKRAHKHALRDARRAQLIKQLQDQVHILKVRQRILLKEMTPEQRERLAEKDISRQAKHQKWYRKAGRFISGIVSDPRAQLIGVVGFATTGYMFAKVITHVIAATAIASAAVSAIILPASIAFAVLLATFALVYRWRKAKNDLKRSEVIKRSQTQALIEETKSLSQQIKAIRKIVLADDKQVASQIGSSVSEARSSSVIQMQPVTQADLQPLLVEASTDGFAQLPLSQQRVALLEPGPVSSVAAPKTQSSVQHAQRLESFAKYRASLWITDPRPVPAAELPQSVLPESALKAPAADISSEITPDVNARGSLRIVPQLSPGIRICS